MMDIKQLNKVVADKNKIIELLQAQVTKQHEQIHALNEEIRLYENIKTTVDKSNVLNRDASIMIAISAIRFTKRLASVFNDKNIDWHDKRNIMFNLIWEYFNT